TNEPACSQGSYQADHHQHGEKTTHDRMVGSSGTSGYAIRPTCPLRGHRAPAHTTSQVYEPQSISGVVFSPRLFKARPESLRAYQCPRVRGRAESTEMLVEERQTHAVERLQHGRGVGLARPAVHQPGEQRAGQGQVGEPEVAHSCEVVGDDVLICPGKKRVIGAVLRPLAEVTPRAVGVDAK